jgi:hypothetical protein
MEDRQTAVEWLVKELNNLHPDLILSLKMWDDINNLITQAKQMEKQQIIKAYANGVVNEISIYSTITGEEYYNETYNK